MKFYLHSGGLDWSLLSHEVEKLVFLSADRYVVQLLDVGWDAEPPYYVMEYVENGSLEDYLKQSGTIPVSEAMEIFHEMVIGLLHAHNKGVLHCDLKPANILLDQDRKPRLADFGQSRLSHEQTPALGTLFYMAPEQAHLEAVPDVRWDIYALGAILYRMLTGEPPHRNPQVIQELDTVGGLDKRLAKYRQLINRQTTTPKIPRQVGLDRSLTEIICRCLEANPDKRFRNVQEVLHAVETRKRNRARRPLTILGILGPMFLLVMMTVFGSYWYGRTTQEARTAVRDRVYESNAWVAKHVARSIEEEIEGPTLHSIAGGAAARPFITNHNALGIELYMRIALELHLKRLLVGGMERVFELGRVYRNEGISPRHNPEFTMLEVYQAYGDYETMMRLTEQLIVDAIDALGMPYELPWGDEVIDFTPPFAQRTYDELFQEHTGIDPSDAEGVAKYAQELGIETSGRHPDVVKNEVFEEKVEDALEGPVFVIDYPASICPLTKRKREQPEIAERFELFVNDKNRPFQRLHGVE